MATAGIPHHKTEYVIVYFYRYSPIFFCDFLDAFIINNSGILQVSLVATEHNVRVLTVGMGLQLGYPVSDVQK